MAGPNGHRPEAAPAGVDDAFRRPYFPLDVSWWMFTTAGMTALQRGAFAHLLAVAWASEPCGTIPDDDAHLASLVGMTLGQWKLEAPVVRSKFVRRGKRLASSYLVERYEGMVKEFERKSAAGRTGATARWKARK